MALFGIGKGIEAGSRDALNAARLMANRLEGLNKTLASDLKTPLRIGIGIHSGPAIVGEMGYAQATSITAVGDTVNTASRLEAMAVGNAVLDCLLEEGFLEQVQQTGRLLRERLEALAARHPNIISEVRGSGLMLGLQCVPPSGDLVARLRDEGLLTVGAADNVVRMVPPLTIGEAEVNEAADIIDRACAALAEAAA